MAYRKRNKTIIICFAALFVVVTTFSLFCLFDNQDVKFISDNIQQDESDYTNNDIVNNNDNNEQISLIEDETIPNIPQNKDEIDYTQLYFYVVFYDQYGNELQRETLKYGAVPTFKGDYPSGFIAWDKTLTAIVGNTYIHARCSTTNRKSKSRVPEKATITVLPQNIIGEDDSSYGTVTGAGTYFPGTTIALQATPKENCIFLGWDDGVKESTRDVVVDVNITYKAIFDTNYLWFKNVGDTSDTLYVGTMVQCGAGTYDSLSWSVDDDGKITLEPQDVIYIKSNGYYTTFSDVTSGTKSSIACGGSIMSLIDEIGTTLEIPSNKSFGFLFSNFTNLTSSPRLTATTLARNCYCGMFSGCTSLTLPNDFTLPATTLAQYCYFRMFFNCTNITLPNSFTLPATTLADYCYYYMFSDCTNLTLPNDFTLPATTLADFCYYDMFSDCSSLTLPNDFTLPATTLASTCYHDMFSDCSSLTIPNGFTLPATTLADFCYQGMFSGCTNLTIPNDFTLPATTLAQYCYQNMFSNCTNLTKSPIIKATSTDARDSLLKMFNGCTNLSEITIYSNDWNALYSSNWVKDVASSGTLYCPTGCNIIEGVDGIPTGWTRANIPIMLTSINKDIDTPLMKTLLEDGPLEVNDIENLDDVFIDFNSLPEF